jgi:hypothetical protein
MQEEAGGGGIATLLCGGNDDQARGRLRQCRDDPRRRERHIFGTLSHVGTAILPAAV